MHILEIYDGMHRTSSIAAHVFCITLEVETTTKKMYYITFFSSFFMNKKI